MVDARGSRATSLIVPIQNKLSSLGRLTLDELAEYVGCTLKHGGGNARLAVKHLKLPSMKMPDDPPSTANATVTKLWEMEVATFSK